MEHYELKNGEQTVKFTGERLAHRSSRRDDNDLRWTEVAIYRTTGGNYVVQKVGRSRVYHRGGQPCTSGDKIPFTETFVSSELAPCPRCKPDRYTTINGFTRETDRHTVHVSETPQGAVEVCYSTDDNGVLYLTRQARDALGEAASRDAALRAAFLVQRVD